MRFEQARIPKCAVNENKAQPFAGLLKIVFHAIA